MTLKNARFARIETLPASIKAQIGLSKGFAIIETKNPELRDDYKAIKIEDGGIRGYLLSLGKFKDVKID